MPIYISILWKSQENVQIVLHFVEKNAIITVYLLKGGLLLRVITGSARGRKLVTLDGDDVRPTTDKVKESLFNIIQFDVEGASFLDLFAGSGQIGIEALSRGARQVVFVDKSKKSIEVVRANLKATGFEKSAVVINADSLAFISRRAERYDIAFLDPPYKTGLLQKALELVPGVMSENGIIICESPADETLPEDLGDFRLLKRYTYGKMALTTYTIPEAEV